MYNSVIEEIKNRVDILDVIQGYIRLQRTGANWRARCPFHAEKTPSFFVSPSKQLWRCFGCSKGGDVFRFLMEMEGVEFRDALNSLAKRAGVELRPQDPKLQSERSRLYEICEYATQFFQKQLASPRGKMAKEYLNARGIHDASIEEFRLGYAPDSWQGLSDFLVGKGYARDEIAKAGLAIKKEREGSGEVHFYDRFRGRIIFPVFDPQGRVIGFGARIAPWREAKLKSQKSAPAPSNHLYGQGREHAAKIKNTEQEVVAPAENVELPKDIGEPKYLNTPQTVVYDKSKVLYGLHIAKVEIRKNNFAIIMEGYTDVILSAQHGIRNVVASSGTALTPWHLRILKRYTDTLFTAYDMDLAGDTATRRGIDLARSQGFHIKVITLEEGKDPADVIAENPEKWKEGIKSAKSIMEYYFDAAISRFDAKSAEGKREIGSMLLPVIKQVQNAIEQAHWVNKLAEVIGVGEQYIHEELKKVVVARPDPLPEEREETPDPDVLELPKSRQGLLEERLLSLLLREPSRFDIIKSASVPFSVPHFATLFEHIKRTMEESSPRAPDGKELISSMKDPALKEMLEQILLRSEVEEEERPLQGKEWEEEVRLCVREIGNLAARARLQALSRALKDAEESGNKNEAERILREFSALSRSLGEGESENSSIGNTYIYGEK